MAYKARTVSNAAKDGRPQTVADHPGGGTQRTYGDVTIGPQIKTYSGKPSQAMLADDALIIEDLSGRPWPTSAVDRLGKTPRVMELAQLKGEWPDEAEKERQRFAEAKLANPQAIGSAMLKMQGYTDREIARMTAPRASSIPDPEELLASQAPKGRS